jgi:glutathione synthase/RimK-type ligase-like ATP-grasp enzyme
MTAPRIALATSRCLPNGADDADGICRAIQTSGGTAQIKVWDDATISWSDFDVVVAAWPWDYSTRLGDFLDWIKRAALGSVMLNAPWLGWNVDKTYLLDLAERGIQVPPTVVARSGERLDVEDIRARLGDREVVAKPVVGAGGCGVQIFQNPEACLQRMTEFSGTTGDLLLQSFDCRILTQGELSATVLDGSISHAVLKTPSQGEFRIQPHFGGVIKLVELTLNQRRFVESVLRALGGAVDYARVDFIAGEKDAPTLMELELLEPDLFLRLSPTSFRTYADLLYSAASRSTRDLGLPSRK